MTQDQVMALVRTVLQFGGGVAVTKGWLSANDLVEAVGAVASLLAIGWSMYHHAGVNKADAVKVAGGETNVKIQSAM